MPDVNSLYPQPPAPPPAATALGPLQLLDMAGKINALQQFQSKQAIGEEAQKSIHGGAFDPAEYRTRVGKRPDAAFAAPEAITQSLGNDRQNIENATALFEQWGKQNDYAQTSLQGLSNLPDPKADDVRHWGVAVSRNADPRALPSSVINAQVAAILSDPRGIKAGLTSLQNRLMGAGGAASRTLAPPGPGGEPQTMPLGGAGYGAGAMPTGLAPGEPESAQARQRDLERAKGFGQEMFPWEEALGAADKLEAKYGKGYFAPGSKGRQEFESFFYGIAPTLASWGFGEDKLKDYAKADKYLTQAVQQRAAGFGVHTDAGLATTISGSPNVSVNDLAVKDVIKASMALRRAEHIQTLTSAQAGGPKYNEASAQWPATHDIRALTLDKLDPEARTKLLSSLKKGTPEYEKFNRTLGEAYATGVMTRPGAPAAASATPQPGGSPTAAPPISGARQAPDGNWYLPDSSRPGKYLRLRMPGTF